MRLISSKAVLVVAIVGLLFNCGQARGQSSLPSGWSDGDVGSVGVAGSASYSSGVFTVSGAGNGTLVPIGNSADGFHFVYQSMVGDGTILARLISGPSYYSAAGVMIRSSLAANAANETVYYTGFGTPPNQIKLTARGTDGTATPSPGTNEVQYANAPYWMKITRSASTLTGYMSYDGINWVQISTHTVTLGSTVYIGLVVANSTDSATTTATFDSVSISGTGTPGPGINTLSASTGSIGSSVTLSGSGFGSTQGSSAVLLNGTPVTVNTWSATSIGATIPTGATSGNLVVLVAPGMNASNPKQFAVTSSPLPGGWLDQDVGAVKVTGSATYSNGVFTIKGAGNGNTTGVGQSADGFHFVYQPLPSDGTIVARVLAAASSYGQAGVMIRASLDASSANDFVFYFGSTTPGSIQLTDRASAGASSLHTGQAYVSSVTPPYWVKVVRQETTLTAYSSGDGINWVLLGGPQTIDVGSSAYIGLGVAGPSATSLATATFDNVSVTANGTTSPVLSGILPTTGSVGSTVALSGSGFGATQGASAVLLNGAAVPVTSWSDTSITITVPTASTSGEFVVSVAPSMNVSNPIAFGVTANPLPSGWSDLDIGKVGLTGSASYSGGVFTVQAAGVGFSGSSDGFHFVYQPLSTDGTITARITSVSNYYAQAGIMIRETLDAYSPGITQFVVSSQTPPQYSGATSNARTLSGGPNVFACGTSLQLPITLSISRTGNVLTVYFPPPPGQTTPTICYTTLTINHTVYVGFGLSRASTSALATATFDNVSVTPGSSLPNPIVTGIVPAHGGPGTPVTVNGTGFGTTQSTSTVAFASASASVTSWSDTQITAVVPTDATTGAVSVQVGNITGAGPTFTVGIAAQLTDSLGNQSTYNSAPYGGNWVFTDSQGSGCSSCSARGVIHNEFDSHGNALWTTDALGFSTTNTYDSSNNLTSQTSTVAPGTTATTNYYYNSLGQVTQVNDALGHATSNTYDSHGNLTLVRAPYPGSGSNVDTHFGYNSLGELTSITDPLGNVTTLTYTTEGLIHTITDAQSNVTTYAYDAHGNRTSVTDALSHTTTFAYDAGDRLTTITYPDSTTTTFTYDTRGRRTSITDQNGKTTTYAYDDADRLTSVTDAASQVTAYGYDTENNLTSITDANSHQTMFTYDAFGRVTQTNFPSSHTETYAYDANNNLTSKTDRKGQTISYVYDALNRLTRKLYPDSTEVDYVYDLVGKIQQVNDPTGTYAFAYDNMGRLLGTTTNYSFLTSRSFTTAYTYDLASNRTRFTDPESGATTYAYDTLNRLTTLTPPSAFTTGTFGFSYDALSRRTQMTRPNGVASNYIYDNLSRLLSVLHQLSSSTIDGASYTVDNAGNRTAKTDWQAGLTTNYGYDAIYQLLSATQGATTTESYTYDPVGNRLSSLGVASYSNNSSNQLTSTSNASYTYDASGNTLTRTVGTNTTTYTWDYENRLTSVALPGGAGTVSFKYDPFGRRIYKFSSSGASIYAYDGDNIVEETNASGGVVARYTQTTNVDEPLAMLRSSATSYYQADGLGSVTSLSNTAGTLAQTYTFDSFGNQTASSGSLINSARYTGRELDSETQLYFLRNRYFDPSTGRFLSEDPLNINGDDLNFYSYVGNNPTGFYDPTGLQRVNSPRTGPPNSTRWIPNPNNPGEVTVRVYGPNGEPVTDYDYGHDHGFGNPHAHDWGKDKSGKPTRVPRRIKPGEKVPPPTCPKIEAPPLPNNGTPYCTPTQPYDCLPDWRPHTNPIFPWLPPIPATPWLRLPFFEPLRIPDSVPVPVLG